MTAAVLALRFPRRPRRRLVLPHGLVALGFLLLLGCRVLVQDARLHRYSVLQLSMMPQHPVYYNEKFLLPSIAQIRAMRRHWLTTTFTGQARADSLNWLLTRQRLLAQRRFPSTVTGTCVRFERHARYASLVDLLDELSQLNARKYTLDIRGPVASMYVLSFQPIENREAGELAYFQPSELSVSRVDTWRQRVNAHLRSPAWRTAGLGSLLAGLGTLALLALRQWAEYE